MRILFLVVLVLALSLQPALAAPKESFETEEYWASEALDIINASQAYALGYTGLGQTVGVLDSPVRVTHPELAGKADTIDVAADWTSIRHGSHVTGIIAARRDGIGMHGVAFDADIWAGPLLDNPNGLAWTLRTILRVTPKCASSTTAGAVRILSTCSMPMKTVVK